VIKARSRQGDKATAGGTDPGDPGGAGSGMGTDSRGEGLGKDLTPADGARDERR
jgi:hypothetical protein